MKCPKCKGDTAHVRTGEHKLDYIMACFVCSWQVAVRAYAAWIKRWKQ